MDANGNKLPRVAESVLKKRRHNLNDQAKRDAVRAKKIQGRKFTRTTFFRRAERFAKAHKNAKRNDARLAREEKKPEKCQLKPKGDLAFVLRIRGVKDVPPKANTVLKLLRLIEQCDGVFLKLNKTTMSLLQIVEPYITWGHPNIKTVRDLIFKKGCRRIAGNKKIPLSDNRVIEKALGGYDIVCIEDLVHEIFTSDSEHFIAVNDFLHNFQLNKPIQGWQKKSKPFKDGGDYGCRFDEINSLLKSLI